MTFLIEMTLQVTITALLILLIKFMFGRKMSSKQHLYIWLILVVRILFPVLPDQPFSIYRWLNLEQTGLYSQEAVMVNRDLVNRDQEDVDKASEGAVLSETDKTDKTGNEINNVKANETNYVSGDVEGQVADHPSIQSSGAISMDRMLNNLWKLGILILNLYFMSVYSILRRKINRMPVIESEALLEQVNSLKNRVGIKQEVKLVEYGEMPMMIGFWSPIILIKEAFFKDSVLVHELVHFKHRDMWWNALACFALSLQWYNPLIWYCFFRAKTDMEIRCDEKCILLLESKKDYAQMLLEQASGISKGDRPHPVLMTTLGSGKKALKMRLQFLSNYKAHKRFYKWGGVIIISVVALLCLGNITKNPIDVQKLIVKQNTAHFVDAIKALEVGSYINLKDVTPFDWDELIGIPPYMTVAEVQKKYGLKDGIETTYNEGMVNWVFLKEGQVVSYVVGYPSKILISSGFIGRLSSDEPFYFLSKKVDDHGIILYEENPFYGHSDAYKTHLNVYPYKSAYIGDASNASQLVNNLLYGEFIEGISLETEEKPYGLEVDYKYFGGINDSIIAELDQNAMMIFALIDNVDQIKFTLDLRAPDLRAPNESELKTQVIVYERQAMDEKAGKPLKTIGDRQETFDAFFKIEKQ